MLAVLSITIFLGAAMLFLVQPMIAKMVLPLLGGSPSVWNTCMMFFQALLLAGYAYAHWSVKCLGLGRHIALHLVLVCVPLALWATGVPPIGVPPEPPAAAGAPVIWLLGALAFTIGPAFFVLSTCGPLIQRWLANTGHPAARDPYFLYAASNAGSMLALLAYPLLVEPTMTLAQQREAWSIGYAGLASALVACAVLTLRYRAPQAVGPVAAAPVAWSRRVRWIFLALVPSSLMLAVTQYLSTDIAAIPLLWIIPLAIYLLTFILAFSRRVIVPLRVSDRTVPILVLALGVIVMLGYHDPIWIIIVLNLAALFFGAMLCHTQLAQSRPEPERLTEFYLLIAVGGVLGGLFNALLAPALFNSLLEYPIILAALCLMRPMQGQAGPWWMKMAVNLAWAMLPVVIALLPRTAVSIAHSMGWTTKHFTETARLVLYVGVPLVACYLLVGHAFRFGMAVGVLFLTEAALDSRYAFERRTFFGTYAVAKGRTPGDRLFTQLVHGTTVHGRQWVDPQFHGEPLIYYHREGPIGDVFRRYGDSPLADCVALVGLGSGAVAAYGRSGQTMTFYEIDPEVIALSREEALFTYLRNCKARTEFIIGDARQSLAREPDGLYGIIVLDAFSSDAVPVHLLTREAMRMYITKLKPGGVLAFHVSNRYLELERVIAGVTRDLGLAAAIRDDDVEKAESDETLHWSSTWIAVARGREDLSPLLSARGWKIMEPQAGDRVWTDDFSSFVGIFQWADTD